MNTILLKSPTWKVINVHLFLNYKKDVLLLRNYITVWRCVEPRVRITRLYRPSHNVFLASCILPYNYSQVKMQCNPQTPVNFIKRRMPPQQSSSCRHVRPLIAAFHESAWTESLGERERERGLTSFPPSLFCGVWCSVVWSLERAPTTPPRRDGRWSRWRRIQCHHCVWDCNVCKRKKKLARVKMRN